MKLPIDIIEFTSLFNNGLSKRELCMKFNCSIWKINDLLSKLNLSRNFRQKKEIFLSQIQIEAIYGSLLGDGSITKNNIHKKSNLNSTSFFSYSSANKSHTEYVFSFFKLCY